MSTAPPVQAESYRSLGREALKHYESGNFEEALSSLEASLSLATNVQADVSIPWYNKGNALYRMGKLNEAADAFTKAMQAEELDTQADAYYNRGNARYQVASGLYEEKNLEEAVKGMEDAMNMYENSIRLNPADREAKNNFELAYNKHAQWAEELEQQQQEQQQQEPEQQEDEQEQQDQEQEPSEGDSEQEPPEDQPEQDPSGEEQKQPPSPETEPDKPQESSGEDQEQEPGEDQPPQPAEAEEMTEEEAEMLLDAMRQEEQSDRNKARIILGKPVSVDKDW